MTVIDVAGCMGLVLVGLGLHDSIMVVADKQFTEITHYQASVLVEERTDGDKIGELISDINEKDASVSALVCYQKSVDMQGSDSTQTVVINVFRDAAQIEQYFTFQNRVSRKPIALTNEGAILSEKTAKSLGVKAGDSVVFQDGNSQKVSVKVSAIFENYIGHYLFLTADLYYDLFGEAP